MKFGEWPQKTIRHFFSTTPSFAHHFKSIGEFKLELQSGNAQFGSKSAIFCPIWWMSKKKIWQLFYTTLSFVHHFKATGELKFELQSVNAQFGSNQRFFVPCDLVNWWMTLKNNRVSFVHHFKAIGKLKLELQSGNAQFGSKSMLFCSLWPWNVTNDHKKKTIGHLFYAASSSVHHFVASGEFKLELQPGNAQLDVWPWDLTDDLEK